MVADGEALASAAVDDLPEDAASAIQALYLASDERLRAEWQRSLSFEDGFFDRWGRAERLGWGEGTSIYNSAMVLEPVEIGRDTWIGPWAVLDGSGGGLRIGSNVNVSAGVHIYTHDTMLACLSGGTLPRREGPVVIGDRTFIGPQSVITAGVTIGHHCVVGAKSFVNKDVPPRTMVAGSPARPFGRVEGTGAGVRIVPLA